MRYTRPGYVFLVSSCRNLMSLYPLHPLSAFCSWLTCCLLLQSICPEVWDAVISFMLTKIIQNYLSYYRCSVSSNLSVHSPLTSHISKVFPSTSTWRHLKSTKSKFKRNEIERIKATKTEEKISISMDKIFIMQKLKTDWCFFLVFKFM